MNNEASKDKTGSFLLQGSILAVAGIIVRLIGLIYKIPLTNYIGEAGIGVYNTAYNIYNILLIVSSYSLPLAVSRLVAVRLAEGEYNNTRRLFICALFFALISGGVFGCVCLFGADFFASVLYMPQAALAIKTLAPTIFIMAFLGVLRGYFQGTGTMVPTAVSQIIEQIIHAVVSIVAGIWLFNIGAGIDFTGDTVDYYSSAYGAAGGTIGTGAGALAAFIVVFALYLKRRKSLMSKCHAVCDEKIAGYKDTMKVLIITILPVLFSTCVYQVCSIIDQGIYGQYMGSDYKTIWGAYSGKYLQLCHIPTAMAAALGSAVIPTLAADARKGNRTGLRSKTESAIRFNMFISIPAAVGLAVLARPIMDMLFSSDNTLAAALMLMGSSAIVFTAISTISNSVLQGIGNIWIPVRNALISLALHCAVLAALLWVFDAGIYGVVIANIVFYILMTLFNQLSLRRILGYRQEIYKTFVSPFISSVIMGAVAYGLYALLHAHFGNTISALTAIVIAVIIYLELLILTKGITEKELHEVRHGETLIRIFKKIHLMR